MKLYHKISTGVVTLMIGSIAFTACTDEIKFGDAFIEKTPGGTVSLDTVFNSAEYTKQFLVGLYVTQYYGLPFKNATSAPWSASYWNCKMDALTDCYQQHFSNGAAYGKYYGGLLNSADISNTDHPLISYTHDYVWETVRRCYLLMDNLDKVPGLTDDEKNNMIAQAKCLIASRYFDLYSIYGGLPIIDKTYTGLEGTYEIPRATAEATANFMVKLLDEAIPYLRWAYNGNTIETDAANNTGRWTAAGAMALKAKILLFNASPLYNNDQPYYDGTTQAEKDSLVWHGGFKQERWERALAACQDFMNANASNGNWYQLNQVANRGKNTKVEDYRQAYRMGYIYQGSREIIHATRVTGQTSNKASYQWANFVGPFGNSNGPFRHSYNPTEEYVEMFPWSDGTPFNWETDSLAGKIGGEKGKLFYEWTGGRVVTKTATRDPRLYENAIVCSQTLSLNWTTGKPEGDVYELWVKGEHEGTDAAAFDDKTGELLIMEKDLGRFATGYGTIKYYLGQEYYGKYTQWVTLSYDEMLLMYAECLAQCGRLDEAIARVDEVRDRVGLKGLKYGQAAYKGDKSKLPNLSTKEGVIEEILRERACELGMSNNRYYDMIRYKRTDWMTKKLHGLITFRMMLNSKKELVQNNNPYIGTDKNSGGKEPTMFTYQKFQIQNRARYLWDFQPNDKEVLKWLLMPMPLSEINKGYGLVQNPGW